MSNDFPLYTTDYISGVMSLRKPQTQPLKILEEITNAVQLPAPQRHESESGTGRCPRYVSDLLRF